MKKLLTLLLLSTALAANAQIMQVSGNQSGTWSGEVHLVGDVVVEHDSTLIVAPGTNVISDAYFGITVLGNFYAEGTENERITFTVADTTGYSDYENADAGAWKGLEFSKPGTVKLNYCDISYGKTQLNSDGGAMRFFLGHDIEIGHCTIHHSTARRKGGAIYAESSALNIHDCEIYDCLAVGFEGSYTWGVGFQFLKCNIDMHDMIFHDNYSETAYGGGMNIDSCNLVMTNAVFYNNTTVNAGGLGIQRCNDYSVKVSNMLAYNNAVKHYGGGLAVADSHPELSNLTIVNNYCGGGGGAGMQNYGNSCPVLSNCIFWGNHAIYVFNDIDTLEYGLGSQIWLWGTENRPVFINGVVQYGLDSIAGHEYLTEENYVNMIEVDPLFVNEENHDYQLTANSPCINTGVADITGLFVPDTDLAGGPRVFDGRIDMGCYEWNNIGVNEIVNGENRMMVYPNPLNDNAFCVIKLNKKTDIVIRLISIDGKEVYSENCGTFEAGENHISLDGMLKNVEKGNKLYLLVVDNQYIKVVY